MIFRRVGNLCAVSLGSLNLPVTPKEALRILQTLPGLSLARIGFGQDCLNVVRAAIGRSKYKRKAKTSEAPEKVDCSSLTQWFYGRFGIELPRRSLQQFESCGHYVSPFAYDYRPGDLIFSKSSGHNYFRNDPSFGVGHVAIVSGPNTAISAVPVLGVVERDMSDLLGVRFRGIRRIITNPDDFYVFEIGPSREIMSSDDFYFIVLDALK